LLNLARGAPAALGAPHLDDADTLDPTRIGIEHMELAQAPGQAC
jgi:hypothetical protein